MKRTGRTRGQWVAGGHQHARERWGTKVIVAYWATILLFFATSFFPEGRWWGVNGWAFFPLWARLTVLGVAALFGPVVAQRIGRIDVSDPSGEANSGKAPTGYWLVGVVLVSGVVFWALRGRTHFLGDGYTLLAQLGSDPPFVKGRDLGEGWLHVWLKNLIGGTGPEAALGAYQWLSIAAGVGFVTFVLTATRRLLPAHRETIPLAAILLTGGYMLMFFGYVENYSVFCLSILMFTLCGLLATEAKLSRWVPLLAATAALLLHVFAATLIPAAIYLAVRNTALAHRIMRLPRSVRWAMGGLALAVVSLCLLLLIRSSTFIRFALLPLVANQFTPDRYTLFSLHHLADFANLLLLLVPGLAVVAVAIDWKAWSRWTGRADVRFLLILVVSTMGAAFVFDPKPGLPRDWDLFSIPGIPLAMLGAWSLLFIPRRPSAGVAVGVLAAVLGLVSLSSRVLIQTDFDRSVSLVRAYYRLDPARSSPIRKILSDQLFAEGRFSEAEREARAIDRDYPEAGLLEEMDRLIAANRCDEALAVCERIIGINPWRSGAWAGMGYCLNRIGMPDSALATLRIADGLNPYNWEINLQLARVFLNLGDSVKAERFLVAAHAYAPDKPDPIQALSVLSLAHGDIERFQSQLTLLMSNPRTSAQYFKVVGENLIQREQLAEAAACLREGLRRGLDSAMVMRIVAGDNRLRSAWQGH